MLKEISPKAEPIKSGESWWVVDPNNSYCEFCVPIGAYTVCTKTFEGFTKDIVYKIVANDKDHGWISLVTNDDVYKMPYYVFARYFDAEAFVKNTTFYTRKIQIPDEFRD